MLFIDSGPVEGQAVEPSSTSAAAVTAGTVTAAIPAARNPGVYNAGERTGSINKALKDDWITETASADGESVNDAA